MEFRILGPLEVRAAGRAVALPGAKPRAVLALLLLRANQPVTAEQLALALWGEDARAGASKTVQVHVSRLRKALGAGDVLVTTPGGYELRVAPGELDADRFERRLAEARAEPDPARAAPVLEEALALWRGRPLADLAYEPFAQREIARLEDLRVAASEELVEAKLALGRHAEVVPELESLIHAHPYRERLRAQLMLALYRCDRQADALQAYQDARGRLVDELGLEPGERLRELERAILAQEPGLAGPAPAVAEPPQPAAEGPPARRLVSIVFADIVGSTGLAERLDPESMHAVLGRYYDVCGAVIERHGGTVEGFIGDAVVGVFGQGEVHEDDSLRAVRAAIEMREKGAELSAELERDRGVRLGMKLGVEAGEVFVGDGPRRARFAAGDAFNVAARLEGSATDGEILLGENVHRLVAGEVRAEPTRPLGLKGRKATVQAWRLLGLDGVPRAPASPFVGRRRELAALRAAFARARDERRCHAVTVIGPAGIGKSRLAHELAAAIAGEATVAVGRCPSYGEGVTYRPLAEIVGELGGARRVAALLDERMARVVLAAVGLAAGGSHAEETFLAVRRLLEHAARERPLAVVVEDIHWAEPTLLDLLEHLLALSSGHPILLVCLARPDLLEARPAWAAPRPDRSLLVLEALSADDARRVVENASGDLAAGTANRIVETAEGNPLFLEQLVAVGADGAALPTTIQAVLAARIDRLEHGERTLLEHASVQGRSFDAGALEGDRVPERLVALVRKGLVESDRSEDGFRFSHALIREAAYRGLPKQRRAELHERLARRAEGPDETVGHHLAEACRLRADLGPAGERERALAGEAAERLARAADAAILRGDPSAAARLLERAASLLEGDAAARGELLPELGAALFEAGHAADAARVLDDAIAAAPEPRLLARAQVERELVRLETGPGAADGARRIAASALDGDERGKCRLWLLRGQLDWHAGRVARADEAWREAAGSARRSDGRRELFEVAGWRALAAVLGPTPVDDAIRRCEELRELVRASPFAVASTLNPLALLHAMKGELETAARLLEQAGAILHEGEGLTSGVSHLEASVRLLAGEPALAEASLRASLPLTGEGGSLATTTALLAQAVFAQGRLDEAGELCLAADRHAAPGDTVTQAIWRGVQARILAREGSCEVAEALAREAVALTEPTDLLSCRGDALLDLAEVLRACGRAEESDGATRAGLALYERKGNSAAAARARAPAGEPRGGT